MAEKLLNPTLSIDLGALRRNYRHLAGLARVPVAAVVKADAYGLGIDRAAPALAAEGADTFFVAHVSEGMAVRAVCPSASIYILNGLGGHDPASLITQKLRPVLNSLEEIARFSAFCMTSGTRHPAAVHVDTGMNRLGLDMAEASLFAEPGQEGRAFDLTLIISHLTCADETAHPLNTLQRDRFAQIRGLFPGVKGSLANSGGCFLSGQFHHDLLRPGVALYGGTFSDVHAPLEPVVSLAAPVIALRHLRKGDTVGYNCRFTAERETRIAIVPVGYADGYPRQNAGGYALVNGVRAPLAGTVSMDLIALDVTDCGAVETGMPATMLGSSPTLAEVGKAANTITYEILTRLGRRYQRIYHGG